MYCIEPSTKRQKTDESPRRHRRLADDDILTEIKKEKSPSPILENKERSFRKRLTNGSYNILKRMSRFPRTVVSDNVVESKFFCTSNNSEATSAVSEEPDGKSGNTSKNTDNIDNTLEYKVKKEANVSVVIEESSEKSRNPFKKSIDINKSSENTSNSIFIETSPVISSNFRKSINSDETMCTDLDSSQKENSPCNSPMKSPILEASPKNPFAVAKRLNRNWSEDTVIENTYPMETLITPVDSQVRFSSF